MEKFALKSMTIVAGLILFLINIGPTFGAVIEPEDGQALIDAWDNITASVASIFVIIGRVRAASSIRFVPFVANQSGAVSIRVVVLSILGFFLIASLSACGGSPQDIQRQSVLLGCSAQATAQGLVLGSPERTAFVAACITPVIVEVVVDEINEAAEDGT